MLCTGGGLPIGSIILIEEDKNGRYAKYLTKLFLAEGTVHKHALFLANFDHDPQDTVFIYFFKFIHNVSESKTEKKTNEKFQ